MGGVSLAVDHGQRFLFGADSFRDAGLCSALRSRGSPRGDRASWIPGCSVEWSGLVPEAFGDDRVPAQDDQTSQNVGRPP